MNRTGHNMDIDRMTCTGQDDMNRTSHNMDMNRMT